MGFEQLDLPAGVPQAGRAGGLHGYAVEQAEPDVFLKLHRRDHALVQDDGQGALALELAEAGEAVGGDGLLQDVHAGRGQFGGDVEGGFEVVAAVGVGPQETLRGEGANAAAELEVEGGVGRDLDVEVAVAAGAALLDQALNLIEAGGVDGPAQGDAGERAAAPELGQGLLVGARHQVVEGEVHAGLGDGHAGGKGRGNGAVHGGVGAGDVGGFAADEGGGKVVLQCGDSRFDSFVAPGGDGDALPPAGGAAFAGDFNEDGGALGAGEELEVRGNGIDDREDFHAGDGAGGGQRGGKKGRGGPHLQNAAAGKHLQILVRFQNRTQGSASGHSGLVCSRFNMCSGAALELHCEFPHMRVMEAFRQDLHYAVRVLRKGPGLTLTAVVSLALGIGCNTAVFSLVHAALLRSLPYPEPDRLVRVAQRATQDAVSIPEFEFWKAHAQAFDSAAGYRGVMDRSLASDGRHEWIRVLAVTSDFFGTLGIRPALGREFSAEETRHGRATGHHRQRRPVAARFRR